MYSARTISNAILKIAHESDQQLTNMQLQKLVYFAHGWYLAWKNEPLISDSVKAWNFGPVIPPLYNRLKKYGNDVVTEPISGEVQLDDEKVNDFLKKVYERYRSLNGAQMSYLTHKEGTPWAETWSKDQFSVIPQDVIRNHFLSLRRPKRAR